VVDLFSRQGDVRVVMRDLGSGSSGASWEAGSEQGRVTVDVAQKPALHRPCELHAWSHWGDVTCLAEIGPECGLNLEWKENLKRSEVQTQGRWHQDGDRIWGPENMLKPGLRIRLSSENGVQRIRLSEPGAGAIPSRPGSSPIPAVKPKGPAGSL
jgi:hypothetical protein